METVEAARRNFLTNQVKEAIASLDGVLAHEASYSEDVLFDARCIRASISGLLGPKEDAYLQTLRPKTRTEAHIKSYLEATASIRSGNPMSAVLKLQSIVREDPHFLAARMGLAAGYMAQKQWNEAFQEYSEVLATTGKNAPAIVRVGLALCAMRRGEFAHAKKCLIRALEVEPNDDLACMAMIVVQLQQRDGPGAAETVKRLYGLAPENPIAVQKFADLVFFKGVTTGRVADISHAIRDLIATAVKLDEGNNTKDARHRIAYSRFQLGRLAHYENKYEEAVVLYSEAIAVLGSTCKAAVLYLIKALYQLGRTAEAVACLQKLEGEARADKEVYTMLVAHHEMAGHGVRGMYFAQQLTDEFGIGDPKSYWVRSFANRHNNHNALKNLAIAKAIPGHHLTDKVLATEEFFRAQQPATAAAALGEMLSTLQRIQNEKDEVKVLSPAAVQQALTANAELLPHYYNIACAMLRAADVAAAASNSSGAASSSTAVDGLRVKTAQKVLVTLVKLFPTFIDPYYRLAELYIAHRQFEAARKWLALALHVRPNDGYCTTMMAKLYFDQRNSRVALETLRKGIDSADNSADGTSNPSALVPSMAMGSLLLWSAQQPTEKAPKHLLGAKECFSRPLRADPNNALAAHGLACCVGFGGNAVSKGARAELTENCLATVCSAALNDPSIANNCADNLVNCMTRSQSYKRAIDYLSPRIDTLSAAQLGTLGYSLAADGQLKAASEAIQKGLERFPQSQALKYNRILVLYAQITKELGNVSQLTEQAGRQIRNLLVLASDLSHEFVSAKHSGSEMSAASFAESQRNVRAMAKQLIRLEECLQTAVRKAVIEEKFFAKKSDEWKQQAVQFAADEAQRKLEAQAAVEEVERAKAEKSRRRYDAMQDFVSRGMGGAAAINEDILAMARTGYEGDVLGEGIEAGDLAITADDANLDPEAVADAITGEALAV